MNYFILVASEKQRLDGGCVSSHEVAISRLNKREWGLYEKTPNRQKISKNDQVLIYASGTRKGGLSFIGSAIIDSVAESHNRGFAVDAGLISEPARTLLRFTSVNVFNTPLSIIDIKSKLAFVPQHSKWGASLIGGCKSIKESDFLFIQRKAME